MSNLSKIKVCENIVPEQVFKKLQSAIFDDVNMPWYYTYTAYNEAMEHSHLAYSFFHNVIFDGQPSSSLAGLVETIFLHAMDKTNQKVDKIIRARIGLIMATEKPFIHDPHVDLQIPHKTALLYLNDSDGDTLIYNETFDLNANVSSYDYYKTTLNKNVTVAETSSPKANKMIWFNGNVYHSSTTPTITPRRLAINFNYLTSDTHIPQE